jgi:hypothetical protein
MSKLLENKQIIHIAAEMVVITGVVFYFSSKNKKLLEYIENLSVRLDEQDKLIQKHEQVIIQLVTSINNTASQAPVKNSNRKSNKESNKELKNSSRKVQKPLVSFNDNDEVVENIKKESSSEDDSELDAAIADELDELNQDSDKQDTSLKKRI